VDTTHLGYNRKFASSRQRWRAATVQVGLKSVPPKNSFRQTRLLSCFYERPAFAQNGNEGKILSLVAWISLRIALFVD